MTNRRILPNRREAETFNVELDGLHFTATAGFFEDGSLAELFLNNNKAGNQLDSSLRDAAVILSFALQYGVSAESIRRALSRDGNGRPLGPVGKALDMLRRDRSDTTTARG